MYDFSAYDLKDLFKIRDALNILAKYELHNDDMLHAINMELNHRPEKMSNDISNQI
jgi:hypothetical protein